mgnify:CR=1 FL=1
MFVNQFDIMVAALPVFRLPAHGQINITDVRAGYIITPGYPGQYPNNANGSIEITTSANEVSLPYHQI